MEAVAVDRMAPNIVGAATANGMAFRSRDAGQSWSPLLFPGELAVNCHALLIAPGIANMWIMGVSSEAPTRAGVYLSRDAGDTWEQLPGMRGRQVWSLAASPEGDIAAGAEDGIYISRDRGSNWQAISPGADGPAPIVSIAFDPRDRDVIYAGTPHLAWKTTDGGAHWTHIRTGMQTDSDVFSITVDSLNPGRVYAGACSGIYRSVNGGQVWTKAGVSSRTYFVAQDPSHPDVVFAGGAAGLVQSVDGGLTWHLISHHLVRGIAFDSVHPARLFLATADAGILRSDDSGLTFDDANQGLCSRHLSSLTESGGSVFANISDDKGLHDPVVLSETTAAAGAHPGYALAEGVVMRSDGRSWARIPAPARIVALLTPADGSLLALSDSALNRSLDGGASWDRWDLAGLGTPLRGLVALTESSIAVVGSTRILTWGRESGWVLASELPGNPGINGVAGDGSHVLLAATSSGLMRSADLGRSWRAVRGTLGGTSIEAVAGDPTHKRVYFAASFGRVYESNDDGQSWQALAPVGAALGRITQLLLSRQSDELFALTEGRGAFVWSRDMRKL